MNKNHQIPSTHQDLSRIILLLTFSLSGFAGLVYEVVWMRELAQVLGSSKYAVTIILSAFMAGLGIGAWVIGKKADQLPERALANLYIGLELGIALYAAVIPFIMGMQEDLYVMLARGGYSNPLVLNLIRLVLAFLCFILPTILMGGTLPVLCRYLIRSNPQISIMVSRLYAVNTIGGVCGVLCAGYVLLPRLGNRVTTLTAVAANLAVALIFWNARRYAFPAASEKDTDAPHQVSGNGPAPAMTPLQKTTIFAFAISGAAALMYEVAWTRTLTMILGTTTFAFTAMLATFLTGIAIGSLLYSRVRGKMTPAGLFILLQFLIAFSVIITIPLFEYLPFIYLSIYDTISASWMNIQFLRFFLTFFVMLVPTCAMGCAFPVVSSIIVDQTGRMGKELGRAYSLNTFGAVAGAIIGGLVLVPVVGMQKTIMIGASINLAAGAAVLIRRVDTSRFFRFFTVSCVTLAMVLLVLTIKPWSPRIMSSGVYVYAERYLDIIDRVEATEGGASGMKDLSAWQLWSLAMKQYSLLYYNPGHDATVSVMERQDGVRFLTIDGKTDAGSGSVHDMKTQVLLGQLPLLFHEAPDRVFIVGLGSGVTAGSVLTHGVRLVDCAELSKGVIEAAGYFSGENHDALSDKRLKIVPRDARNVLLTTKSSYEVIISQPSNPWVNGQSSLFSLEWYKIVDAHLEDGGIFAQWIPAYFMSDNDIKIIIHTLRTVFPHITAWSSGSKGDLIFLARKGGPLKVDYEKVKHLTAASAVRADIARLGIQPELLPLEAFKMNENEISLYLFSNLKQALKRNTDDLLYTEYSTPRQLMRKHMVQRIVHSRSPQDHLSALMEIVDIGDLEAVTRQINSLQADINGPL